MLTLPQMRWREWGKSFPFPATPSPYAPAELDLLSSSLRPFHFSSYSYCPWLPSHGLHVTHSVLILLHDIPAKCLLHLCKETKAAQIKQPWFSYLVQNPEPNMVDPKTSVFLSFNPGLSSPPSSEACLPPPFCSNVSGQF